jgi:hypothetical protein
VVLQVKACAINHLDVFVLRGWPSLRLEMPHWGGRVSLSVWVRA